MDTSILCGYILQGFILTNPCARVAPCGGVVAATPVVGVLGVAGRLVGWSGHGRKVIFLVFRPAATVPLVAP